MSKQSSSITITTCDHLSQVWSFEVATKVPKFCEIIDDYEEQQQQDWDNEYPPPASEVPLGYCELEDVREYLENEQTFLTRLEQKNSEELTALWNTANYLGLPALREPLLAAFRIQEQQRQQKNFYVLLREALDEIINSTPEYFFDNIQPQTNGSYEDRLDTMDELKQQQSITERAIPCTKYNCTRFDNLIRLALCRIVYIIENHGAKADVKNDFGLKISDVFEYLICALLEAKHTGRSGDGGVDGLLSDRAVIQCKAGASHRGSAARIWRELLGTCLIHKKSIAILAVTDNRWNEPPEEYQEQSNASLMGSALGSIQLQLYSQRKIISALISHRNPRDLCTRFLNNLASQNMKMHSVCNQLIKTFQQWNKINESINKFEGKLEEIYDAIQITEHAIDEDIPAWEIAYYEDYYEESSSEEEEEEEEEENGNDNDDDD